MSQMSVSHSSCKRCFFSAPGSLNFILNQLFTDFPAFPASSEDGKLPGHPLIPCGQHTTQAGMAP